MEQERPIPAPPQRTYPVDFILANNGSGGDASYCIPLTSEQIKTLLSVRQEPLWVRIPEHYYAHNGVAGETRWLQVTNCVEVHIGGDWEPPVGWEWRAL